MKRQVLFPMTSKFNEHLFEQALLPASTLPNAKGKRKGQGADEGCSHLKVRPQGGPCKWKKGKWMFLAVPDVSTTGRQEF